MSGISDTITSAKDSVFSIADDLSGALDFGNNAPARETTTPTRNPEVDISEIDRTNPINHNATFFGLPPYVAYGVGALVALVIIKKVL